MNSRRLTWFSGFAAIIGFLVLPLLLVVVFSFATNRVVRFPLEGFTLDLYRQLLANDEFLSALNNSMAISIPSAILATLSGTMFALSVSKSRRASALMSILATPAMLPPLVVAIGLVVLFVRLLSLPLGYVSVIMGHVLLTQPLVALIVAARLAGFDETTMEAARDLGASPSQAFWRVKFPQIRTAIIGAGLIAFAISLDEFIVTVFAIGSGNTVSTFVWGKMRTSLDPSINAVATLSLVLTIALTAIAARLTRTKAAT